MLVVGVDVGGTKIAAAAIARDCSRSAAVTLPTPKGGPALLAAIEDAVRAVEREAGARVAAVGVGLPSVIQQPEAIVRLSANIDLRDVAAGDELRRRLAVPVAVDNDANVAAIAEHRAGAGRGHGTLVLLTLGTGVGGGVIVDGRSMRGGRGMGAELGHMVVDADGPPCQRNCPNRGCLETMASGTAIERDAGVPAEEVVHRASDGDPSARAILERAGRYLGIGLSSLANIFNPDVFVIGGGAGSGAGEYMLPVADREYRRRALPPLAAAPVVPAALGPAAGAVGAGLIAWDLLDGDG